MFLSILSIPLFLLLCCYTPRVYGICDETEITCSGSCTIRADNATRTSYLIKKCAHELALDGKYSITFYVYLEENNGTNRTITLDVSDGITRFYFYTYDTVSIEFNRIQTQIQRLSISAYNQATIYCPYGVLNYFPSVTYLHIYAAEFDRFPYLKSANLRDLRLHYLILPSVVTILPSMLILPNLIKLESYQKEGKQWYNVIPSSFDNTVLYYLYFEGVQHLHSYHFANLKRLTVLSLGDFPTNFTFEENALAGLDVLELLYITYLETNLEFVTNETFPNLIGFDLRHSAVSTLAQEFFGRQKELTTIYAYTNPFHCDCEMAWVSHVTSNLGWSVSGTCDTPSGLNGNFISNSSNYNNCPNNQSYHCLNDTFICPPGINCVNTADSAYCDCGDGYTLNGTNNLCEDINECTGTNSCEHNCTNSVGSYSCSCNSGFTLQPDMSSCVSGVSQLTAPIFLALLSLLLQTSFL